MSNIAIRVEHLTKKYTIGRQKDSSLRGSVAALFSGGKNTQEEFIALNDVSFDIQQGDVVGIIGKNGAGKSTLLKVLSQITKPTQGRIEINGRVASLLEVGTGFHPELTGRENIYLNGTILGMTRKEVKFKFDEIVDFSGVEKFIDTPVKHYSSGMYVRLAFAVAAHLEPEILVIDEVLAVGDAEFQKKCLGKMQDVAGQGRTIFFVSHNLSAVKSLCNRGIVMENGKVVFDGTIDTAVEMYTQKQCLQREYFDTSDFARRNRGPRQIYIKDVTLNSSVFDSNSEFSIKVHLDNQVQYVEFKEICLMVFIYDQLLNVIYQLSSNFEFNEIDYSKDNCYEFIIPRLLLSTGTYSVGVWLGANGYEQDYVSDDIFFEVQKNNVYSNKSQLIVSAVQTDFKFKQIVHAK